MSSINRSSMAMPPGIAAGIPDKNDSASAALAQNGAASLLAGDFEGVYHGLSPEDNIKKYEKSVKSGSKAIKQLVGRLFGDGGPEAAGPDPAAVEKLKKYVESGELQKELEQASRQNFAIGGEVQKSALSGTDSMAQFLPEHHAILQTAKARVNNYLNSIRPPEIQQKLPFDSDMPMEGHERNYKKVLELAEKPLTIMNDIHDGSLTPDRLSHFKNLYPEIHEHLNKKISERMVEAQLAKEKPVYHRRQAMSLFMGSPLDSSLTPQSIVAAQSTYMNGTPPPQQPQQKKKPQKDKLKDMAQAAQTPTEANITQLQKS